MSRRLASELSIPVFLTSDEEVTYPHAHAHLGDLRGPAGNVFAVVSTAARALRQAGVAEPEVRAFTELCFAGDYAFALQTVRATLVCTETGPGVGPDGHPLTVDDET